MKAERRKRQGSASAAGAACAAEAAFAAHQEERAHQQAVGSPQQPSAGPAHIDGGSAHGGAVTAARATRRQQHTVQSAHRTLPCQSARRANTAVPAAGRCSLNSTVDRELLLLARSCRAHTVVTRRCYFSCCQRWRQHDGPTQMPPLPRTCQLASAGTSRVWRSAENRWPCTKWAGGTHCWICSRGFKGLLSWQMTCSSCYVHIRRLQQDGRIGCHGARMPAGTTEQKGMRTSIVSSMWSCRANPPYSWPRYSSSRATYRCW